jgi:hypothetical protein
VNTVFLLKHLLIAAAALPMLLAGRQATLDGNVTQTRISNDYRANKAICAALSGQASDVCFEQARARMKMARAEFDYGDAGDARHGDKVQQAEADTRPLAGADAAPPVAEARTEGSRAVRGADYKPTAVSYKARAL